LKCPKCGKEMEQGYFSLRPEGKVMLRAEGGMANYWSIEKPGYHKYRGFPKLSEDAIKIMWTRYLIKKGRDILRGFRCPNCEIITFKY
jgi:hypothetical protein